MKAKGPFRQRFGIHPLKPDDVPTIGRFQARAGLLECLWIPENLLLGRLAQCRLPAGMRKSQTIVDEDGFWLRGHDRAHDFVSVALGRDWVNRETL
ncbi:MAG TPA: hypothetical protein VHP35_16895, partial [Terriglobia bacterium]|nr:hypothetical protein [Terriglobia bacterium]